MNRYSNMHHHFCMEYFYFYEDSSSAFEEEAPIGSANVIHIDDSARNQIPRFLSSQNNRFNQLDLTCLEQIKELILVWNVLEKLDPLILQSKGIIIDRVHIEDNYRHQGFGTRFMDRILLDFKRQGYAWVFLIPYPLNTERVSESQQNQAIHQLIQFYTNHFGFEYYPHTDFKKEILQDFHYDAEVDFLLNSLPGFCFKRL